MNVSKKNRYDWLRWLRDGGAIAGCIIGLVVLALVLGIVYYLDERMEGLHQRLTYDPPSRYTPPDLSAYAVDQIDPESIKIRHSVYVPVYSHVYSHGGRPYLLEATLSIRNIDTHKPIYLSALKYYNTEGELVKKFVDRLIQLKPLQSLEFVIEARDSTGGSGSNVIIDWMATDKIDEPIIEAILVGRAGPQSFCFRSTGKTLTSNDEQTEQDLSTD